jgi:hypothetical protein
MSKSEKRLERMRNNPQGDWVLDDFRALGERYGLKFRHEGGSHATFSHPSVPEIATVPARRPIKPYYVKRFIELIDKVRETQTNT